MTACFLSNSSAKYYENPTILSRVIAKNIGDVFLRHSVHSRNMQMPCRKGVDRDVLCNLHVPGTNACMTVLAPFPPHICRYSARHFVLHLSDLPNLPYLLPHQHSTPFCEPANLYICAQVASASRAEIIPILMQSCTTGALEPADDFKCLFHRSEVWNSLPDDVTSAPSLSTFRRHLKT